MTTDSSIDDFLLSEIRRVEEADDWECVPHYFVRAENSAASVLGTSPDDTAILQAFKAEMETANSV